MAKKNKYQDYSKETQAFMNAVEKHLIDKFGEITPHWDGLLQMLAVQVDLYNQCKAQIKNDGLMVQDRFGSMVKHPLIKCQTDALIQINKLSQDFGLNPRSLKGLNIQENNEDEFLENLTSGD